MKSLWNDSNANAFVAPWRDQVGDEIAQRLYSARLIGKDPSLVLHGGGNVSVKYQHTTTLGERVDAIAVKASGFDLQTLPPQGLPGMDLACLQRFAVIELLDDETMTREMRRALFDPNAASPSIETFVHAFLPHRFVDHSHADAVLAVTNHADGESLVREAVGDRFGVLPYVRPGFDLAKAIAELIKEKPTIEGIVLLHHGLITFGDDAKTSYERHIRCVNACEQFLENKRPSGNARAHFSSLSDREVIVRKVAPILRGMLSAKSDHLDQPYQRPILEWRCTDEILEVLASENAGEIANAGPLTGDHLIRTKPWPLFFEDAFGDDEEKTRVQFETAIESYAHGYRDYIKRNGGDEQTDVLPRVVLIKDVGIFAWGNTRQDAIIAADIAEHTLLTVHKSWTLGPYQSLGHEHLFDMEFRGLQTVKLRTNQQRPLEHQVVVISGAAGAIGAAVADVCLSAGAHVALTDLDLSRLEAIVEDLETRHGKGSAIGLSMDVTSPESVRDGYDQIVRTFGGVDVIVPNAGIAHVDAVDELDVKDFRRVMEVNAVGYLLFMQEGIKILKSQGLGGHIVINASKNVFGPGKDFGAYSASKAAGHQLGKVAAIELAPHNIRVNMINADAVFGNEEIPSGLWATVGPQRAKSRDMDEKDLPEYYRGRNLLKTRVFGHHVGNAVVFFASNATPTTGATLPVDGGVVEAFPR